LSRFSSTRIGRDTLLPWREVSLSRDDPTRPTALTSDAGLAGRRMIALWDGGFREYPLPDTGSLDVGRSRLSKLQIDHPSVSRRHLIWHADADSIEDLGSSNGTRVNGERIASGSRRIIRPGDTVEIGRVLLMFQGVGQATEAEPPREGAMDRVRRLVDLAAPTTMTVLLLGETGVGKDVLAERIHRSSARADGPFVRINCVALSESLLESELFGHEKGAFTGAVRSKPGLLEAAHQGSLLLDEIGEMPLATQAKLLVALERREVLRVGALSPRAVDVRFIAATNRDLGDLAARGGFRPDLLHRLNGVTIHVPPLRERVGEIGELAREFSERASTAQGRAPLPISPDGLRLLEAQRYPGNIRELKNLVERAVAFAQHGTIDAEGIRFALAASASTERAPAGESLREQIDNLEKQRILEALDACGGNQTKAAVLLGMPRRTLVTRLSTYGLTAQGPTSARKKP
jgi:transcriptional regulator with AAA-type ATPase domain